MNDRHVAFVSGVIFALGLGISGMTQPTKVRDFLDVTGAWDPSLALVMGGAVLVYLLANRLMLPRLARPILGQVFALPSRRELDPALLIGAAIFGVGWGLGGLCPGPALVSAISGSSSIILFVAAMILGMAIHTAAHGHDRQKPRGPRGSG